MKSDEANKEENNRLKKIVADQAMVVSMLKEIAPENGPPLYRAVSPSNGKKKCIRSLLAQGVVTHS